MKDKPCGYCRGTKRMGIRYSNPRIDDEKNLKPIVGFEPCLCTFGNEEEYKRIELEIKNEAISN